MKTIAIANQKGGTGKTTTAYNLGIALTQQGYRVLMVDFDPQGNLSCYCGIPPEQDLEQTITELLMKVAYAQPSSLRGGPGSPSVGINLDCSSFVQYCYWAQNLPFSAGSTAAYRNVADLVSISPSEVQPGDLRVVYASGGEQGHVQMALGGGAWIECCYGYGVAVNMSNAWMESRPCYYFRYAGF